MVLLIFTIRTFVRNSAWKDNFTLFTTDVKVSANSVKCNVSAGGDYQKKAALETDTAKKAEYYRLSLNYLERAISIYPNAGNGLLLYGNGLSLYKKEHKLAIVQYLKILDFDPYNQNAFSNTLQVLNSIDSKLEPDYKISVLKQLFAKNPENADVNYNLGKLYGQFKGNPDSACYFLERSINLNPTNISVHKDLGIVYSMKGEYTKALDIFSRAGKLDPSDNQIRQNIQITLHLMDQKRK